MSERLSTCPHPIPSPRRAERKLPCHGCATPTEVSADAVRVLCPDCTARGAGQPGRFFPRAEQAELLRA